MTLDIAPVNDAPITLDLNVTLIAGFQSTLDLNELAEDIDGDPLSFRLLNPTPFTDRFVRVSSLGAFVLASPKEFSRARRWRSRSPTAYPPRCSS